MEVRHAQLFGGRLNFAQIPNIGFGEFVLEEALVIVPRLFRGTFGQPRQIFGVSDWLFAAALGDFCEQCEVQTLDRFAAFGGQFRANAAFVLKTRNLMAAEATEELNPFLAFGLEARIIHERRVRITGRILLLLRDEEAGDVLGV
jgi:hypothetical protein